MIPVVPIVLVCSISDITSNQYHYPTCRADNINRL